MSNITTQNRIARQLDSISFEGVDGLTMLQHFDYPLETWSLQGNASLSSYAKFGKYCVTFPDSESAVSVSNSTGIFTLYPTGSYEAECFMKTTELSAAGNVMKFGDGLTLNLTADGELRLAAASWGIDETSEFAIGESAWIPESAWYHVLLRVSGRTVTVYVDGWQEISASVTMSATIEPEYVTLGGYIGYMDEFAFRQNAGTGAPEVPSEAYETGSVVKHVLTRNAPVTRAAWTCENLPAGVSLSSSGVLSGHPTTAGTYDCDVSVATNWGTDSKTIRIVVE